MVFGCRRSYLKRLYRNAAGKSKYYFSKSAEGNLVENIPEKYEIYENPNGQVFLRPKAEKIISEEEK